MKKLHEKSPCCRAQVVRFGGRRRKCMHCGKTWRVWRRRRGRKRLRGCVDSLRRFLDHVVGSSTARAAYQRKNARTLQRTVVRSRDLFCRTTSWPALPATAPLILLADATPRRIRGQWHTVFCMLLRDIAATEAVMAPPVVLQGTETIPNWRRALATLPNAALSSVRAMVCDGHTGLLSFAKRRSWLIQRCQFHLIAAIQGRRSRWRKSRHYEEGKRVYALVRRVLDAPPDADLTELRIAVDNAALSTDSPQLRRILMGFASNAEYYRTHLYHPLLNLPRTNNASESYIGLIESLLKRLRGVSSTAVLLAWVEALVKHKRKIVCNGAH